MGSVGDCLDVLKEGRGDVKNETKVFTFIWVVMGKNVASAELSPPLWQEEQDSCYQSPLPSAPPEEIQGPILG